MNVSRWVKRLALTRIQKNLLDKFPGNGSKTARGLVELVVGLVLIYYLGYNPLEASEFTKIDPTVLATLVGAIATVQGTVKAAMGAWHKVLKHLHRHDEDDSEKGT